RRLYHPCLETFLRALPFAFSDVPHATGTSVEVEIVGAAGGRWRIECSDAGWEWSDEQGTSATATVRIPESDAWQVFTKRRNSAELRCRLPSIRIDGDVPLGEHALQMVSVMA